MTTPSLQIEITADATGAEAGLGRVSKAVADTNTSIAAASRSTKGLTGAFGGLSTATRGTGGGIQNVAFQIGDFATQVGAGTSASVALGQQLPQLLGGFGALGAVMGAVAAVGIPLAASFIDMGDEADNAADALDDFIDAMGNVQSLAQRAGTPIEDLAAQFGEFADEIQRASRIAAQAALSQAMRGYQDAANDVRSTISNLTVEMEKQDRVVAVNMMLLRGLGERTVRNASQYDELSENIDNARSSLEEIAGKIGLSVGEAVALNGALDQLGAAEGPRELAQAASAALDEIDGIFTSSENIPPEIAKIVSALERVLSSAASATTAFDDIAASANDAADASMRIQVGSSVAGGRGGDPRDFGDLRGQQDPYGFRKQLEGDDNKPNGSVGRRQEDRIGALAKSLMTEGEMLENWRTESLEKLADFNALELEALGGHNEARLRIEEEYQNRLSALQSNEMSARLNGIKGALSDASSLMRSGNEKLFKIGKAASVANAVVSGYEAATEAWSKGMAVGGPPAAAAFTAASLARTGALIAQISSQNFSSGGGGASAGAAAAAPAPQQLNVDLSVRGSGSLANDPSAINQFADALLDNFRDRGLPVVIRA
jgi:hypothetical protein